MPAYDRVMSEVAILTRLNHQDMSDMSGAHENILRFYEHFEEIDGVRSAIVHHLVTEHCSLG